MARKQIRISRRVLFTCFMLAGFIFLFTPHNITNKFQFAFARLFCWPLSIGRSISLSVQMGQPFADSSTSGNYNDLRRRYNQLQNHLANVVEQLNLEHKKAERLSGLRNRFPLEGAKFLPADVIRASIDGSQSWIIINRGQNDGLAKGVFVLGDNSIIGIVSDVASREARVRLFTDPTSRIEVKIAGLGIERVMQGIGGNSAKIPMVSTKLKVKIGQKIFARRKPGLLDVPIIIGTVARCKEDDEKPLVWDITVKPACDLEKLKDIDVLIMNPEK